MNKELAPGEESVIDRTREVIETELKRAIVDYIHELGSITGMDVCALDVSFMRSITIGIKDRMIVKAIDINYQSYD